MRRRSVLLVFAIAAMLAQPAIASASPPTGVGTEALVRVAASDETIPRFDDPAGGNAAADDPAIWVHPTSPANSVVLGTLKNGGLDAYDLAGKLLQHIPAPEPPEEGLRAGNFNNVDLVQGADVPGLPADFAVVTDRGRDRLRIYAIDPAGAAAGGDLLTDVTDPDAPRVFSRSEAAVEDQLTGYGLAVRINSAGAVQAIASQRNTTYLRLLEFRPGAAGLVTYVRKDQTRFPVDFTLPNGTTWHPCTEPGEDPKLEGMVVHRPTGTLFAAQEEVGVWRVRLADDSFENRRLIEPVIGYGVPAQWDDVEERCEVVGHDPGYGGSHLVAQVEGMTVAYTSGGATIVVSSQGDSTFARFRLGRNGSRWTWFERFAVVGSDATDAVTECDGAAVVTTPLGPLFPHGLLVVQDGYNLAVHADGAETDAGQARPNTNFKYVPWERVRR